MYRELQDTLATWVPARVVTRTWELASTESWASGVCLALCHCATGSATLGGVNRFCPRHLLSTNLCSRQCGDPGCGGGVVAEPGRPRVKRSTGMDWGCPPLPASAEPFGPQETQRARPLFSWYQLWAWARLGHQLEGFLTHLTDHC